MTRMRTCSIRCALCGDQRICCDFDMRLSMIWLTADSTNAVEMRSPARWMQVRSTGYALMHLLALHLPETFPLATIAPWRKRKPVITVGLFAAWMRQHFFGLAFRQAYDRKSEKFTFPAPRLDPPVHPAPA